MTQSERRIQFLAAIYLAAIEANNHDRQQVLWHMAATDSDLDAAMDQVHADLLESDDEPAK